MAILTPAVGSDRFSLFAAAAITGSAQHSGAVPTGGVDLLVFEITTDGNNSTAATFTVEGTNDPAVAATTTGWLPAETFWDSANQTLSTSTSTASVYQQIRKLPASTSAFTWTFSGGFTYVRFNFTGGSAAGLLTVNCQRMRKNG